jgi:hypothetical protein
MWHLRTFGQPWRSNLYSRSPPLCFPWLQPFAVERRSAMYNIKGEEPLIPPTLQTPPFQRATKHWNQKIWPLLFPHALTSSAVSFPSKDQNSSRYIWWDWSAGMLLFNEWHGRYRAQFVLCSFRIDVTFVLSVKREACRPTSHDPSWTYG